MRVFYLRSFDESLNEWPVRERKQAVAAASKLLDYFAGGPKPLGIGLRKLRKNYWEIRASLDKRILFLLENDALTFVIAGHHADISRFLRK